MATAAARRQVRAVRSAPRRARYPECRAAMGIAASRLNLPLRNHHRVATDRGRRELASAEGEREMDQARPPHLEPLLDDEGVLAVAGADLRRHHAGKGGDRRTRGWIFGD